ncbi:alpha/beta fold hydrolase [Kamptonema formosum]|uniref:alpha/beta fold hydrolase n=1 Tax=Kamptonema formosum TaxID=331992 RepID=UPI0012DFE101|nr:alpha/beta fold hydrolase [Oscillatoria sp. PCC 10802]
MNQEIRPRPTCLYQMLETQAEKNPNAIAITAPGREPLTYGNLCDSIQNIVAGLNAIGVGRNDRVAVALANGPEMAAAFLGIASGATCAPLNPAYRTSEFDFYLSNLNAKALIIQSGVAEPAAEVARKRGIPIIELSPVQEAQAGIFSLAGGEPKPAKQGGLAQPDDIALVLHTSGTTSRPKIVPLTHSNLACSAQNIRSSLQLVSGDCCLNVMPLFHIHGLIGALLSSLSAGASVVCTPGFSVPKFFEWLDEFRPTWYTAVPTMHQAILARAAANREIIARCGIRLIRSSSAALPPQVMAEIERTFSAPVIEAYGMTEASHQMASNPLPPRLRKAGSVGVAAGPAIAIVDESGNVLSAGETGEIVIRGASVTAGYENNPKANESAFTQGWFRTGDQGYLDSDGYLFIKGRIKELINRGGEKISPREVDEVLLNHSAVAQAVTFALPHPQLGEDVGAAVILRENLSVTEREIQEFAAAQLADFKVPRRVIFVGEIPKGATGKLQRIGLAEKLGVVADEPAESLTAFAPPSTLAEEKLAAIWLEVLGIEKVGVRDNFFELGGDSILAAQIVNRVRSEMQVELSFLDLWQNPTVAGMAAEATRKQAVPAAPIQRISREGELPLSFAQARMWFFEQLEPENPAYNRPVALRLTGKLNVAALEQSLNEIVRRHEVLRASFPAVDGVPVGAIAPNLSLSLLVTDISDLPERERKVEADRRLAEDAQRPFDLARGPLVRATLLPLSSEDHRLLLAMHHTVFDGWSVGVLLQELGELYEAFSTGNPSPLPALPVQYADFTVWQQQWLVGEVLESQLAYWKKQLAGAPFVLELPADRLRPAVQTYRGAKHSLMLPVSLGESLKKLSQQEKVTLFVTLISAFATLLYRYTGQDDVIIGTPIAGRNRIETEKLIGVFINTLVLRTNLAGNPAFRELLGRVEEVALGALAHQDLPFEKLVEELKPQRDLSRSPVFQVMFQLRNLPSETGEVRGLKIEEFKVDIGVAKVDLTLEIVEKPSGLSCLFEYSTDLFDAATIERMGGHFQTLLEGIVANPQWRVSDLPLLTEAERHQLQTQLPSAFVTLDALPVTLNNKIDRRALPAPEWEPAASESGFTAPRDNLEIELQSIWERVLGVRPIGVTDNFFDLGGHSLLGVRLLAQIDKIFGKNLPLATLFGAPTIERLADVIRQKGWVAPSRSLVAIQAGGTRKPLFCVHGLGGQVLYYYNLASYLGKEQPVYGLQSRAMDGQTEPHTKIEDMAADYIKEMRTVQPYGPYFLAGYSLGGAVAFEMARQLVRSGEKVAMLAVFDTYSPTLNREIPSFSYRAHIHLLNLSRFTAPEKMIYILEWALRKSFSYGGYFHLLKISQLTTPEKIIYIRDRLFRKGKNLLGKLAEKIFWWAAKKKEAELPHYLEEIKKANAIARKNYVPQVYPGRLTLLRAIERPTGMYYDPYLGWEKLAAGGVEIVEVPGNHVTIIWEPRVRVLAEKLRECLDR